MHTWKGHPIKAGERWEDPVTNTIFEITDGGAWGFPGQPWVRWLRKEDMSSIGSWPILSLEQYKLFVSYKPERYINPAYRMAFEDACGIDGKVWTGEQSAAEYAMRNAPASWEVKPEIKPPAPELKPSILPLIGLFLLAWFLSKKG
jgi:hypothetical protein